MIENKIYKLKKPVEVAKDMPLEKGQELIIVMDVVYVNGYPLPPSLQNLFYSFIMNNLDLFDEIIKTQ